MIALQEHCYALVLARMSTLTSEQTSREMLFKHRDSLVMWCQLLSFGRWLQVSSALSTFILLHDTDSAAGPTTSRFGQPLVTKILSHTNIDSINLQLADISAVTLAILLEEHHTYVGVQRLLHLDIIVAAYIALSRISSIYGETSYSVVMSLPTHVRRNRA